MPKKHTLVSASRKLNVKKKVVSSKTVSKVVEKKSNKCCSSWIWWILGVLVLLVALFFVYKGMTGNVITGYAAADISNAFDPIVQMVSGLIKGVYTALEPVLRYVVGDIDSVGDIDAAGIFLAKLLLLLLVFSLVSSILLTSGVSFLKDGWTHWITSGVVAILSVRYLSSDLINTILMPYSTFGVVISAALPFVLYFFFVEKSLGAPKSPALRRAAWIFFGVVFLAIWVMRQDVADKSNAIVSVIYPLTALLSIIMALIDGTIQNFFNRARIARSKEQVRGKNLVFYYDQLNECNDHWKNAVQRGNPDSYHARIVGVGTATGMTAYNADVKEIQKRITAASK